jgi:hypothetical protein
MNRHHYTSFFLPYFYYICLPSILLIFLPPISFPVLFLYHPFPSSHSSLPPPRHLHLPHPLLLHTRTTLSTTHPLFLSSPQSDPGFSMEWAAVVPRETLVYGDFCGSESDTRIYEEIEDGNKLKSVIQVIGEIEIMILKLLI